MKEYPWFHECGIPVDNYGAIDGIFRDIKKRLVVRESGSASANASATASSEQVGVRTILNVGAFVYQCKNGHEG
jgi:hypothetical protein